MGPDFNEVIRIGVQVGDEISDVSGVGDFCAEKVSSSDPLHA